MTVRTWTLIVIAAFLVLASATTCGYQRGVSHGKSVALVAKDDSIRKVDAQTIHRLTQTVHDKDVLAHEALMERDTAVVKLGRARARRDTSLAFANAERQRFTLNGDTAVINGLSYVLPVTVSTYVRLTDTYKAKQGELDAMAAEVDSNASRTIARLLDVKAAQDTLILSQGVALAHDAGEIKDLKAQRAPRLGFRTGLSIGAASVLTLVLTLSHFVK